LIRLVRRLGKIERTANKTKKIQKKKMFLKKFRSSSTEWSRSKAKEDLHNQSST
jgi:hypothetical protein